jgi:2-dehydro-3-deoxygalactonokinase
MTREFIALDWGTTSFRAYHVGADGKVLNDIADANGILAVKDAAFEQTLENHIAAWDQSLPVLAAGMITSRQGWIELPYVDCPAGAADLGTKPVPAARSISPRASICDRIRSAMM